MGWDNGGRTSTEEEELWREEKAEKRPVLLIVAQALPSAFLAAELASSASTRVHFSNGFSFARSSLKDSGCMQHQKVSSHIINISAQSYMGNAAQNENEQLSAKRGVSLRTAAHFVVLGAGQLINHSCELSSKLTAHASAGARVMENREACSRSAACMWASKPESSSCGSVQKCIVPHVPHELISQLKCTQRIHTTLCEGGIRRTYLASGAGLQACAGLDAIRQSCSLQDDLMLRHLDEQFQLICCL